MKEQNLISNALCPFLGFKVIPVFNIFTTERSSLWSCQSGMLVSCYLKWWKQLLRHVWQDTLLVFWLFLMLWLMGCTILWTIGRNYTEGSSECFLNQYCSLLLSYIWFNIHTKGKVCSFVTFLLFSLLASLNSSVLILLPYLNTWKPLFLTSLKDVMLASWNQCFCFIVHLNFAWATQPGKKGVYLFVKGEYSFMNSCVMNSWFIYLVISFQRDRHV